MILHPLFPRYGIRTKQNGIIRKIGKKRFAHADFQRCCRKIPFGLNQRLDVSGKANGNKQRGEKKQYADLHSRFVHARSPFITISEAMRAGRCYYHKGMYKKPAFWAIAFALLTFAATSTVVLL